MVPLRMDRVAHPTGGSEAQSDFGPECAVYVGATGRGPGSHETGWWIAGQISGYDNR